MTHGHSKPWAVGGASVSMFNFLWLGVSCTSTVQSNEGKAVLNYPMGSGARKRTRGTVRGILKGHWLKAKVPRPLTGVGEGISRNPRRTERVSYRERVGPIISLRFM